MGNIVVKVSCENSGLRNLEQLRAQHAYAWRDKIRAGAGGGRAVAKKVPAMIISNGFLGALAFAISKESKEEDGHLSVFEAIIDYLHTAKVDCGITATEPDKFMDELCAANADTLRAITSEAMAYLNYLRRFAKPGKDDANGNDSK